MSRLSLMYFSSEGPNCLKSRLALADVADFLLGFRDHLQRVVVADGDALGAPLALAGVDDDREAAPLLAFLLGALVVLAGLRPLLREHFAVSRVGDRLQLLFEHRFGEHLAENGRCRGNSVTQSMQPVQFSVMYSGISGAT